MPAKKKTSKSAPRRKPSVRKATTQKTTTRKTTTRKSESGGDAARHEQLAASLERIEARLGALESRGPSPEARARGEDLGAVLRPAVEAYRESVRTRREQQMQTPWVMAGLVGILAVTVAVLGSNHVLSGGTVAVLLTGSVGYALFQLQKALR